MLEREFMSFLYRNIFKRTAALMISAFLLLQLQGCGVSWKDLWSRENPDPNEQLFVEKGDDHENGDVIYQGAVEYTGLAHSGTDIYYVGKGENRNHIIVIDPGHQLRANADEEPIGPDASDTKMKVTQGATSAGGLKEYELNLQVSLVLRDILIERGYSVVMTRETNEVNISNAERAQIANKYNASAFVRVHANSNSDTGIRGVQVLCQSEKNPFLPKENYSVSRTFADIMLNEYCKATDFHSLSIIEDDTMAGINWSRVPTVILEMGFLSNEAESKSMSTAFFRRNAAEGMANAVDEFIAHMKKAAAADTKS